MVEDQWSYVLSLLPEDLEQSARETLALLRRREVKTAECLLRLVLAYGVCDKSFREVSAWAKQTQVCQISDVGVLKRLRYCGEWLKYIINSVLAEADIKANVVLKRRIRIVDATFENRPGRNGTDWKLHFGYDLASRCIDEVLLTGSEQGESLSNFSVNEGDIFIGDRGYAHRRGIWNVKSQGGDVIVRINWQNLPLVDADGNDVDIISLLKSLKPKQIGQWQVWTKPDAKKGVGSVCGRFIAVEISEDALERELERIKHQASKKGRQPDERSLMAAGYLFVFTSVSAEELSKEDVLELFRFRWQIEISFKRLKGLLEMDKIRACSDEISEVYLLSKVLGALLLERLAWISRSFSPWGYRLERRVSMETL